LNFFAAALIVFSLTTAFTTHSRTSGTFSSGNLMFPLKDLAIVFVLNHATIVIIHFVHDFHFDFWDIVLSNGIVLSSTGFPRCPIPDPSRKTKIALVGNAKLPS
jgi:hypothetical protein